MKMNNILVLGIFLLLLEGIVLTQAARLPTVDGDSGTWGTVMNEYLNISLNGSGEIREDVVGSEQIINNSITGEDISNSTNLTLGQKITFTLGEVIDNIIDGWLTITGSVNITGNFSVEDDFFIDKDTGNIGIGTPTPVNGLNVVNRALNVSGGNVSINESVFFVDSSSGMVGIGTASPGAKLEIYSSSTTYDDAQSIKIGFPNNYYLEMEVKYNSGNSINFNGIGGDTFLQFDNTGDVTTLGVGTGNTIINGNVGIGTVSPKALLDVNGNITATDWTNVTITESQISDLGNKNSTSWNKTGTDIHLATPGDSVGIGTTTPTGLLNVVGGALNVSSGNFSVNESVFFVDSSLGRVGIGTASPSEKLDIVGGNLGLSTNNAEFITNDIEINNNLAGAPGVYMKFNGHDTTFANTGGAYGDFFIIHGSTTVVTVNDNVGIGTVSPKALLEVNGNITATDWTNVTITESQISDLNNKNSTSWNKTGTDVHLATPGDSVGIGTTTPTGILNVVGGMLNISSGNFSVNESVLFVDSSRGMVGIGTAAPSQSLEVNGGALDTRTLIKSTGSNAAVVVDSAANSDAFLRFSEGGTGKWTLLNDGDDGDKLKIQDDGDVRMTFQQDGNVGIGTTTPKFLLEVAGNISALDWTNVTITESQISDFGTYLTSNIFDQELNITSNVSFNNITVKNNLSVNTNTLFVDSSLGQVGIGTASPDGPLQIHSTDTRQLEITNPTNNQAAGIRLSHGPTPGTTHGATLFVTEGSGISKFNIGDKDGASFLSIITNGAGEGNVGIGTASPSAKLHVNSSGAVLDVGDSAGASIMFVNGTNARVGINTTSPAKMLHVLDGSEGAVARFEDSDGTCDADPDTGGLTWSCSSDERLKENIEDAGSSLDNIMKLKIRKYNVKSSGEEKVGVVAQEVMKTRPELIKEREDGILMVSELSQWEIVKAIQELAERTGLQLNFTPVVNLTNQTLNQIQTANQTSPANITIDVNNTQPESINTTKGLTCVWMENGILISKKGECKDKTKQEKEEAKDKQEKKETGENKTLKETGKTGQENISLEQEALNQSEKEISENQTQELQEQGESEETRQAEEQATEEVAEETPPAGREQAIEKTTEKETKKASEETAEETKQAEEQATEEVAEEKNKIVSVTGNAIKNFFVGVGGVLFKQISQITGKSVSDEVLQKAEEGAVEYGSEFDVLAIKSVQELRAENQMLKQELCLKDGDYSWC